MSNNATDRQRGQAASALANVSPMVLAAMVEMADSDPETLAAIVAMVNAGTDDSEVAAYAVTIAPRMWVDRRNGAPLLAIVRGALAKARRTVALAGWDVYGDMTDAMDLADDGARTSLSHYGTAPADAQWDVTYGDAVMTAVGTLGEGDAMVLAGAGRAFVKARREYDGTGRPVALAGALAMREGWTADDSRYHAARRMTLAACKRVNRPMVLALTGAVGARPTYGTNRVSVGNGFPSHDAPTGVVPGRAGREVPAVTVRRRESVTVDYVWCGDMAGTGRVMVWDADADGVVSVPWHAVGNRDVVDSLGYRRGSGYGETLPDSGGFRGVREDRETVRTLPPVTVGGTRAMLPPDVIVTGEGVRTMTDEERETAGLPDAGRVAIVESGDAPDARPDDSPMRGDVTASGTLKSHKPVVSPRKRVGGNTGPTVPVRLPRA